MALSSQSDPNVTRWNNLEGISHSAGESVGEWLH